MLKRVIIAILMVAGISVKGYLVSQILLTEKSMGALTVSLGFALLMASFVFLFKKKYVLYAILSTTVITITLYVQYLYMGYFKTPITMYLFLQTSNAQGMGDSILGRIQITDILFFVDILLIIIANYFIKEKNVFMKINKKMIFTALFILSVLLITMKPVIMLTKGMQGEMTRKFVPTTLIGNYGIFGHQALDVYEFMFKNRDIKLTKKEKENIKKHLENRKTEQLNKSYLGKGILKDRDVVFIQLESIQNFVLNEKIEGAEITPNLNKMIKNSLYVPNMYPQTAEGNSSDAELISMNSIYPIKEGSTFFRFPERNYPSVMKEFQKNDYGTTAYHGDEGDFWNRDTVYPNMGIETYEDITDFEEKEGTNYGMGLGDKYFFEETAKKINQREGKNVSYVISLTSHYPFNLPEDKKTLTLEKEMKNQILGNYFESVHYTDEALGEFIENIKKENKDTVFVLFGDHNGIFKENKEEVEKWITSDISDEEWIEKYTTIPFIIHYEDMEQVKINDIAGQIDIKPTIEYLFGFEESPLNFGINLLKEKNKTIFLLKGDYGQNNVIGEKGKITNYTNHEIKDLEYSEKLIKSNFGE
jgi:phosphoglycerol transferase MdoB-like AlkP superfamily enzyme